jgi:hypothetical protein
VNKARAMTKKQDVQSSTGLRFRQYIAGMAVFALASSPAIVQLDRGGNVKHEGDGGGSGSPFGLAALVVLAALTLVLYEVFQAKWPNHNDALYFNLAWVAALVIG